MQKCKRACKTREKTLFLRLNMQFYLDKLQKAVYNSVTLRGMPRDDTNFLIQE